MRIDRLWWEREDLCYRDGRLQLGGFDLAPLERPAGVPLRRVTIAGNINEAIDLLAEDIELPAVAEGDLLALLNAGGYGSSASSNHCMRGEFREHLLGDDGSRSRA